MFYPDDPQRCADMACALVSGALPANVDLAIACGGIVPHAGWICSGAIAGQTIGALQRLMPDSVDVVVVFGAVHTPIDVPYAALDSHDGWVIPGGVTEIAGDLSSRLRDEPALYAVDDRLHRHEHAVEVEVPLIRAAWPKAMVLPIEVPLVEQAVEMGERTARHVAAAGLRPVYLASSDLTHYGPSYQFAPAGVGETGFAWALENDERLLRIITDGSPEQVVAEVRARRNACGGGAIAAMLAACRASGATRARVLRHANSYQTLMVHDPQPPDDAVGYAAVIVGSTERENAPAMPRGNEN
jgi:hypothetical protein